MNNLFVNMRRKYMTQTEVATYTVLSTANGATVYFDGEAVGTIGGGQLVVTRKGSEIKDSFQVELRGGSLPSSVSTYEFSFDTEAIVLWQTGSVTNYENQLFAPISREVTTAYEHETGKSVEKNGYVSIGTVTKKSYRDVDWTANCYYNKRCAFELYSSVSGNHSVTGYFDALFDFNDNAKVNGTGKFFNWTWAVEGFSSYSINDIYEDEDDFVVLTQAGSGKELQIPVFF